MGKKILITGAAGMIGSHLIKHYCAEDQGATIIGLDISSRIAEKPLSNLCKPIVCDVLEKDSVADIVAHSLPPIIYHLAAQPSPTVSMVQPRETFRINCGGTINVFEAIKAARLKHHRYDPLVIVACSSAQYGASLLTLDKPATEETPFMPVHPYGASKVAQEMLALQYFRSDHIKTICARIFNTTGPGKTGDVVSDFLMRAVNILNGKATLFPVGNLDTCRAIIDVRDTVRALTLLSQKGAPGTAYNISGKTVYRMRGILDLIEKVTEYTFTIKVNSELLRPVDEPLIIGDSSKLIEATGWEQLLDLEQTIRDMYAHLLEQN
jgi:GDP-4-dehydro-6-deoxy-D-mannose reductase